jgi:hypothetical protein
MDIAEIKSKVILLRALLMEHQIHFDGAILFGSYARGNQHAQSDVDIAILSRDFGHDRFKESSLLNKLAFSCIPYCDAIPLGLHEYFEIESLSPIGREIQRTGVPLF